MLLLLLLGGWVWPADFSCLLSCRFFVTSAIIFALSDYGMGPATVHFREQDDRPPTISKSTAVRISHTHCVMEAGDPLRWNNRTKWPECPLEGKLKLISPKAIMHLPQQQVELQSQSFIFNSTRVSGQTNVLLISSLLLPKRGGRRGGRRDGARAGLQGVRAGD